VDENSVLGGYNVIFANTSVHNSVIGAHSFIQKNSRINNADIGKFCSISSRVSIGLGRHSTTTVSSHPAFYSSTQPVAKTFSRSDDYVPFKRILIGNDVWIGENVMIMDGVKIGNGAVIAMGAVVTGNVPDYAIVAGNPGRVFSSRFDEETRKRLLDSQWWNKPDEWMQENCDFFSDPVRFLGLF
jgi:acetyltransferase-like isoleucine patch superfamily enzyme